MEPDPQCHGAFLDLAHGMRLYQDKELHINKPELFQKGNFIFYTAGIPNDHDGSRLSTAEENVQLANSIFQGVKFTKTPHIIVITNPVDIVTLAILKITGLPSNKVIGTGTYLDSQRLAYYLSEITNYSADDIDACVLGEHGASQVPIFSMTKIKGKAIMDFDEFCEADLDSVSELTKNAAFEIRKTQSGTRYGVAKCAESIFNMLLGPNDNHLVLSICTNDYYRILLGLERDIVISLPVEISGGQINIINNINLTEKELLSLKSSALILSKIVN